MGTRYVAKFNPRQGEYFIYSYVIQTKMHLVYVYQSEISKTSPTIPKRMITYDW